LPSTNEGLPLTILEAQAAQVPVLAAPTAGIPEVVVHKQTGFLIPAHDILGYAHYIKMLLDDPSLSHCIRAHAYERVLRESSWQSGCTRMQSLYKQLQE
jgi:glycosyltransferase involved in cell wall biosynthesis